MRSNEDSLSVEGDQLREEKAEGKYISIFKYVTEC